MSPLQLRQHTGARGMEKLFLALCFFVGLGGGAYIFHLLPSLSGTATTTQSCPLNSATGSLFDSEKVQSFTGKRLVKDSTYLDHHPKINLVTNHCERWGVVTTIFDPSDAIVRFLGLPSWCLVIVPDLKTPGNYMSKLKALQEQEGKQYKTGLDNVFFFSVEKQREWQDKGGPFGSFVQSTPWHHFCRKNIGYLFAILHGANFIFDFDDDNLIKLGHDGLPVKILPEGRDVRSMKLSNVNVAILGANVFNHHPFMGASIEDSWARGFPQDSIQDKYTQGQVAFQADLPFASNTKEIGVIQYLADGDPDVDARHRISKPLPMTFDYGETARSVLVPAHAYSPYNAQATIHTKKAFWGMLLPSTVPRRVSDIWRSYFAQCIFADAGLQLVFSPPKIMQERNKHNYLGDLNAEQDLYCKAGKLVEYLKKWDSESDNIPERMEDLWIDLYEHGYIEIEDVYKVQMWLRALAQVGYKYPPLKRRYRNVAVMGQFNFADNETTINDVIYWTQKTREYFQTVVAVGPFSNSQMKAFQDESIIAKSNDYDHNAQKGFFSPLGNLRDMLLAFKNSTMIDGVLYAHDDAILNITELSQGQYPFPTSKIMHTFPAIRVRDGIAPEGRFVYRAFPDGHFEPIDKNVSFESLDSMFRGRIRWYHAFKPYCSGGQILLAQDPSSLKYRESDGSMLFPQNGQSDFMFVPTKYADQFAEAAELHLKHSIFIECAFPKVLDIICQRTSAETRGVKLCTSWPAEIRGSLEMIESCINGKASFGVVHPFKISKGYKEFSHAYDQLQ